MPLVPQIVETQHYGSIAQGTGEALFVDIQYNEDSQGDDMMSGVGA